MTETAAPKKPSADRLTRALRWIVGGLVAAILLAGGVVAYMYLATPPVLRHPTQAHFHLRLQIIADGKPVDFAADKFQTDSNKDVCTAALTKQPVHFHDQMDQFVHIHWNNITGGILLKNYGWSLIGGSKNTLGYRFEQLPNIIRVPIHGDDLPKVSAGDHYYIYTSSDTGYKQRDWNEFLKTDLRTFLSGGHMGFLERIVPGAYAHNDSDDPLVKLNDVVGDAVIFVQSSPPTAEQINLRFSQFLPLPNSICGG